MVTKDITEYFDSLTIKLYEADLQGLDSMNPNKLSLIFIIRKFSYKTFVPEDGSPFLFLFAFWDQVIKPKSIDVKQFLPLLVPTFIF